MTTPSYGGLKIGASRVEAADSRRRQQLKVCIVNEELRIVLMEIRIDSVKIG